MGDFRSFSRVIQRRGQNAEKNGAKLTRQMAGIVLENVVKATPADVGTAKSNWFVGINSRPEGTRDAYAPGKHGSTAGANENAAIDRGKQAIAQYKLGSNIHLTNNLPYIGLLNAGSSSQAPAGFVERALLIGKAFLKTKRKLTED
jgi:hypothetical protein